MSAPSLTSKQRIFPDCVAVAGGKKTAKREESPGPKHGRNRWRRVPRAVVVGRGLNMAALTRANFVFLLLLAQFTLRESASVNFLPLVINTWPFVDANEQGN